MTLIFHLLQTSQKQKKKNCLFNSKKLTKEKSHQISILFVSRSEKQGLCLPLQTFLMTTGQTSKAASWTWMEFFSIYTQGLFIVWNWVFIKTKGKELPSLYCYKNEWLLLWFLWKMMFMAVDSDVTATVCSPVCEYLCQHPLVIDLLQSNLTGRNSLRDNHVPQIVMKCTTQTGGREPIRGWRKR